MSRLFTWSGILFKSRLRGLQGLGITEIRNSFIYHGAVLIYSFSKDDFKGVSLNTKDEWQQIVRHYRSGMICSVRENLKNRREDTGYIFREIASRVNIPGQDADTEQWESWIPTAYREKSQLCITRNTMAKAITPKLEGIIYLTT